MKRSLLKIVTQLQVIVIGLTLLVGLAKPAETLLLSGSYQVLQRNDLGSQTRLHLKVHLSNHGTRDLLIERVTLWDFSHPTKGATQASSLVLRANASVDLSGEFTVPRSEYDLWRRGSRPRLVLEVRPSGGPKMTQAVRLDRVSDGKAN